MAKVKTKPLENPKGDFISKSNHKVFLQEYISTLIKLLKVNPKLVYLGNHKSN